MVRITVIASPSAYRRNQLNCACHTDLPYPGRTARAACAGCNGNGNGNCNRNYIHADFGGVIGSIGYFASQRGYERWCTGK